MKTRQWILVNKPKDLPDIDGPNQTFQLVEVDLSDLKDNEVLLRTKYLSNDPAQRGWISPYANPERIYVPLVEKGHVMRARGVAEVIESRSPSFKKGDEVIASVNWSEYTILPATELRSAVDLPGGLSKTHYLGALGITGLTAYFGLTEAVNVKVDDTVVISGAAGATGMMAVQIAKKIIGCKKVIGIAGSDESCRWVENLGADLCLNYKNSNFISNLKEALPGPDSYADVYFDNVGGEILDIMLNFMAKFGRIAACGAISNSNTAPEYQVGLKGWNNIIAMRISIRGFIVLDYMSKFPQAIQLFRKSIQEDKLRVEGGECIVNASFEEIPKTWLKLFEGRKRGKLITAIQY